jgi:hypothetical protein
VEQKHLVENIHLTHEKIQYFDDIIQLYYQALKKKHPEVLKSGQSIEP